jgi:hypothetical protein
MRENVLRRLDLGELIAVNEFLGELLVVADKP